MVDPELSTWISFPDCFENFVIRIYDKQNLRNTHDNPRKKDLLSYKTSLMRMSSLSPRTIASECLCAPNHEAKEGKIITLLFSQISMSAHIN